MILSDYVSEGPTASTALATTTDFKSYTRLGIITSKGSDNKDVVLFPEKTNLKSINAEEKGGNTNSTCFYIGQPVGSVQNLE